MAIVLTRIISSIKLPNNKWEQILVVPVVKHKYHQLTASIKLCHQEVETLDSSQSLLRKNKSLKESCKRETWSRTWEISASIWGHRVWVESEWWVSRRSMSSDKTSLICRWANRTMTMHQTQSRCFRKTCSTWTSAATSLTTCLTHQTNYWTKTSSLMRWWVWNRINFSWFSWSNSFYWNRLTKRIKRTSPPKPRLTYQNHLKVGWTCSWSK